MMDSYPHEDDLDTHLAEEMRDPEFAAAYEDAGLRTALVAGLAAARRRAGLSQAEVARRMGTVQSAVSEIEKQMNEAHLSTLLRYARAVGVRLRIEIEETTR